VASLGETGAHPGIGMQGGRRVPAVSDFRRKAVPVSAIVEA
jgi:hypothetical protein